MLTKDTTLTLPLVLAAARSVTSLGSTDWGMLQAGVTVAVIPCVLVLPLAPAVLRLRPAHRGCEVGEGV